MNVLITGAAGFLGNLVAQDILNEGILVDESSHKRHPSKLVLTDVKSPTQELSGHSEVTTIVGDLAETATLDQICAQGYAAIFHLAALVSGGAEADFCAGMRANFDASYRLLERIRLAGNHPRLVFASSIAVYGGDLPETIDDRHHLVPESSYGAQKAMIEILVNEYSRRGFLDGRSVRLPIIAVRPGTANTAASSWASAIIREPLKGKTYDCPVEPHDEAYVLSPRKAVKGLIHAQETSQGLWRDGRAIMMPGTSCKAQDLVDSLQRISGTEAASYVRWKPAPSVRRIVTTWPTKFELGAATCLGFSADDSIDSIVKQYIHDTEIGLQYK